jgi:putative sterol carrier protein
LVFQPGKSAGLHAAYQFTFTGEEEREATIVIAGKKVTVEEGHVGESDLHVPADAKAWIGFLRQERNIVWALLRRKVRLKGPLKLLLAFGRCFPG